VSGFHRNIGLYRAAILDNGGNDNEGRSIRELFGDLGY
jgi:hypothetical protein